MHSCRDGCSAPTLLGTRLDGQFPRTWLATSPAARSTPGDRSQFPCHVHVQLCVVPTFVARSALPRTSETWTHRSCLRSFFSRERSNPMDQGKKRRLCTDRKMRGLDIVRRNVKSKDSRARENASIGKLFERTRDAPILRLFVHGNRSSKTPFATNQPSGSRRSSLSQVETMSLLPHRSKPKASVAADSSSQRG